MANTNPIAIQLGDLSEISQELDYRETIKTTGIVMQCPVRLGEKRNGSDLWTLPLEPTISVKASKTVVRRNIAKSSGVGTVKEQWSQNDYEISISGLLQSSEINAYPEAHLSKLQSLLAKGKSLVIRCKLLDVIGVGLVCIDSWEFPATAGIENQEYSFSGFSDEDFDLVITI